MQCHVHDSHYVVDVFEGTVLRAAMVQEARRVLAQHGREDDFEFLMAEGELALSDWSLEALDNKRVPSARQTIQFSAATSAKEAEDKWEPWMSRPMTNTARACGR